MTDSTDVTGIPPQGLTAEVVVAGLLFATTAGLAGLASLSAQSPPSALLLLGWPLFAVVGGILLDQNAGLPLGRTLTALSGAPVAIVVWSLIRSGDIDSTSLAGATADLAAPLGCVVAIALPWAFRASTPSQIQLPRTLGCCVLAAAGSGLVLAARVAGWPGGVQAAGWVCAVVGTLGTWSLAARLVQRPERTTRRRMFWLLVTLTVGGVVIAATWTLWPGLPGFYATCGALMIGPIVVANLWGAADFRPLDEHVLDLGLVLGVAAASAVIAGLVHLGSEIADRPSNVTTVVFTALLTAAMTTPAAFLVRRSLLARRYGSGLIPPEDVAAITADLHSRTEPRDLLDKAARMVAAASGSSEVRIVLGDDDPSAPEPWVVHPLEIGGDRVGFLLIESANPEGPEARQQQVVAQLMPTVALVARAVGLAVEAEHARRDVARERDAERKRVMGDLHDGLGPALAGMSMRVQAALRTATSPEYTGLLADLAEELATSRTDLRRIVAGITPTTLDDGNLDAALRALVHSFRNATDTPVVQLRVALEEPVVPAIQVAVYRSVAEGITNGLRHASASTIDVCVRTLDGRVLVEVADDGMGGPVVPGVGLSSLARRAESLGGDMTICPGPVGTTLRLELSDHGYASAARQDLVIGVLVVDDHPVVLTGLTALLDSDPQLTVVGTARSAAEARGLPDDVEPEVAVLDMQLPDGDGILLGIELKQRWPQLRVLILTMHADESTVIQSLASGLDGYLLKDADPEDVLAAVHSAAGGAMVVGRSVSGFVAAAAASAPRTDALAVLDARDLEILELLVDGLPTSQVAARLYLAPKTIRNRVSEMLGKLGVATRAEAIAVGRAAGLGAGRFRPGQPPGSH